MRFLAAWFSNPNEHMVELLALVAVVAVIFFVIRKIQNKSKS